MRRKISADTKVLNIAQQAAKPAAHNEGPVFVLCRSGNFFGM
jgi:hypothetical protein